MKAFSIRKITLGCLLIPALCYADCRLMPEMTDALIEIEENTFKRLSADFNPPTASHQPQVLVFLSFSMKPQSLREWLSQTARVQGQCLLRGFVENSLEKTQAEMLKLFEGNKGVKDILAPIQVHPEAFEQFGIQQVPAVVVTEPKPCVAEPCTAASFDVIYGNTSLEDALTTIASRGSREAQPLAKLFLQRYRAHHE